MSRAMITESNLTAIADAIRAKLGVETTYTPAQMATAIGTIHGEPVNQEKTATQNGEVTPDSGYDGLSKVTVAVPQPTLVSKSIAANGSYDPASDNADGYSGVTVNVPNSYAAGDEGKVVSNGQLVAQTAHADATPTTSDQTIDTTNNNSIKVKGDANLQAGNIKNGVQIFGVTGSYEGGGGGGATLITKTITENGTYNASSDNADGYSQVTVNVSGGGGTVTGLQFHLGRLKIDTGDIEESSEYCYSDLIPISSGNGQWFIDLTRSELSSYYIGICFIGQDGETHIGYIRQYQNYRSYASSGNTNAKYFRIADKMSNLSFANVAFLNDRIFIVPQASNVYQMNPA